MQLVIDVVVTLLQIALFAFLMWGASLCLRELMWEDAPARQVGFERVASLVLLALLCTTLAGVA